MEINAGGPPSEQSAQPWTASLLLHLHASVLNTQAMYSGLTDLQYLVKGHLTKQCYPSSSPYPISIFESERSSFKTFNQMKSTYTNPDHWSLYMIGRNSPTFQ